MVYGATSTNLIMDARPTTNAMANTARGAGTENMDHYKEGRKVYLGIDHIHAMRESLAKVVEALKEADAMSASINDNLPGQVGHLSLLDRQALRRSGWLKHISNIMEGTVLLVRNVHVNASHVLIHCSDGWDRTSQLSSLSQLCLDPFYRTMRGFQILVEKDWLGFGHRFLDRCGHLSSEKFFVAPVENANGGTDAKQALAFLTSVQNRIISPHHIKETSPVFHQFLESVRQIQRQFPQRFEFNERFLHQLYYHLYSCQFGTFLYNCERERRVAEDGPPPCDRTICVWDFFNSPPETEKNLNPDYDPTLDDRNSRLPKADMGVLFPNPKDIRFWHELYGRSDEEMNGRIVTGQVREGGVELSVPVEDAEDDPVLRTGTPSKMQLSPSPAASPAPLLPPARSAIVVNPSTLQPSQPSTSRGLWNSSAELLSRPEDHSSGSPSPVWQPAGSPARSSSPGSAYTTPPNRSRTAPKPDLFGEGVKSVWGKFSSNASAAFSVVQDAYDGVTKDFKGLSASSASGDGEMTDKTAEMRSRDSLEAWADNQPSSRHIPQTSTISPSSNPWASVKGGRLVTPAPFENPWSSVRTSSPRQSALIQDLFDPSTELPRNSTIERASPRQESSYRSASPIRLFDSPTEELTVTPSKPATASSSSIPPPVLETTPPPVSNTDPLGVGSF
jgi:myotubularin-related protein 6/7/8